ncbi:hypothetical protein CC2G_008447 [Coprinopsis cinerea AmutBmut pab1-1]|nr:hypothetical protein CC2G_008447 [Coprinopsis cinerea AmutBmut pab1-1]
METVQGRRSMWDGNPRRWENSLNVSGSHKWDLLLAIQTAHRSRVIDDLLPLEESTDRKVCVLFAYNRYTEPLSLCDILKGFVLQVVERHQHLAELVKPIKKRCTSERTEPTSDNLIDLLLKLEGHFDFVYYGLDGMDEVQFHTRIQLVKAINQLRGNFVIASRRLEELQSNLQRAVQFPLVARNEDMTLLIEEKLMWYQGLNGILEDAGCREKIIGIFWRRLMECKAPAASPPICAGH